MAIGEWELWACAHELIRQHGADAAIHAAMRADTLDGEGEIHGSAAWRQFVRRINELQAEPGSIH